MKRLIIVLIIGMMLLSMTGCQEEASSSNTGNTGVLKVEDDACQEFSGSEISDRV